MHTLFDNAVQSIQLGIEDYEANDPKRALSAVRNFYAGTLLLAKESLIRKVPKADPSLVLGAKLKSAPDGKGGIVTKADGHRTIDFSDIARKFKEFNIPVDHAALNDLNRIRNDIEHLYTTVSRETVLEAIGKAFPVVVDLFKLLRVDPLNALGQGWKTMLNVREVYERELKECRKSFKAVKWRSASMTAAQPTCPKCDSDLVENKKPKETRQDYVEASCRACGQRSAFGDLIVASLLQHFADDRYMAIKDGGYDPLHHCPECGLEAYVLDADENGCAVCDFILEGDCARCGNPLTPDDVAFDNHDFCSYCDHVMSKDD
jgi:hypothetical protein